MKNWNRTGILKALLLVLLAIPNFVMPFPNQPDFNLVICLGAFLLGGLFMLFVARYNLFILDKGYTEPEWNDHPLSRTTPLAFFQFLGMFFLTTGLSIVIGTLIHQKMTSSFGWIAVAFGFGMLLGMYLVAKTKRKHNRQA